MKSFIILLMVKIGTFLEGGRISVKKANTCFQVADTLLQKYISHTSSIVTRISRD